MSLQLIRWERFGDCLAVASNRTIRACADHGGYVNENYAAIQKAVGLTREELVTLARNSFEASFLSSERKTSLIDRLEAYAAAH
jgi:adenosine deaminase